MTRQSTTAAGVAAIIAIIAATIMLGVLPQHAAATNARVQEDELVQTNSLLSVQLAAMAEQSKDLAGLDRELGELREQIPDTADLAGVTRVIVNSLLGPDGTADATLVAITPQVPAVPFTPRPQLTAEVGDPEMPAVAPPVVEGSLPAGTFQEIPLTISATAADMRAAFRFVDLLNDGPRLLAVHHVQIMEEEVTSAEPGAHPIKVLVTGAAYLQPSAVGTAARSTQ